jgi:hypothetical protein
VEQKWEQIQKTKEEMDQANLKQAVKRLTRKVNANFRLGDWHVVLTYRQDMRPTLKEIRDVLKRFLDKIRRRYRKVGSELKYIIVTEYEAKAIHHHLLINDVNLGKGKCTRDFINECWTYGNPKYVSLYGDGDFRKLAEYFAKETKRTRKKMSESGGAIKQLYSCSRNLIDPKPVRRTVEVKRMWSMDPKSRKGYYIDRDTLYNGVDKYGYPYQSYTMIRLDARRLQQMRGGCA